MIFQKVIKIRNQKNKNTKMDQDAEFPSTVSA